MNTSLALYYNSPESAIQIKKTCLRTTIRPTEVLIAVSALELSHFDLKLKKLSKLTRTKYLGRSFSGKVVAAGSLVPHLKPGDRVCGSFKSLTLENIGTNTLIDTARHIVFKTPNYLSDFQATTFPLAFGTAWELAFNRTPTLPRESRVLVMGGGTSVGHLLIQLLQKLYNLNDITVVCSTSAVDKIRDLGIASVIDDSHDVSAALVESVGSEAKFTVIYDCMGGYESLAVWQNILKNKTEGGSYLTIHGDAPDLNKSESIYSLVKNAAPYIPRNVGRMALGRLTGIDYHFVTWIEIPLIGIEYAANNELGLLESSVWNINDTTHALEHLKTLDTGSRVVIDMKSTPRDIQELGDDCPSEVARYSEYIKYKQIKYQFRRSLYRVVGRDQEPLVLALESPPPQELIEELESPLVAEISDADLDYLPGSSDSASTPQEAATPEYVLTPGPPSPGPKSPGSSTRSNRSKSSSFNTKFKRIFKRKNPIGGEKTPIATKKEPKFVVPAWLGGGRKGSRGRGSHRGKRSSSAPSVDIDAFPDTPDCPIIDNLDY